MPVQWRSPSSAPKSFLRFVSAPPTRVICGIQKPTDYAVLALHFCEAANQSMPCLGPDECRLCPGTVKVHAYTVLWVYDRGTRSWCKMICDLGHKDGVAATSDIAGKCVAFGRERERDKRSNLTLFDLKNVGELPAPPDMNAIDVRPHLMRRYGLYQEADYFAPRDYPVQAVLPFSAAEQRPDENAG